MVLVRALTLWNFCSANFICLDECGSPGNRAQLVRVLSTLHEESEGHIRVLVISRAEPDIREGLHTYAPISIAAASEDLQIYVNARLSRLNMRNASLKEEIMDVLIHHADGM